MTDKGSFTYYVITKAQGGRGFRNDYGNVNFALSMMPNLITEGWGGLETNKK